MLTFSEVWHRLYEKSMGREAVDKTCNCENLFEEILVFMENESVKYCQDEVAFSIFINNKNQIEIAGEGEKRRRTCIISDDATKFDELAEHIRLEKNEDMIIEIVERTIVLKFIL